MSIFSVGGPRNVIVPLEEVNTTEENRYFLPGVIHGGEDYVIQVWGWNPDGLPEGERIGVNYLFATQILAWEAEAIKEDGTLNEEMFEELINERAENFTVENDGTGDFVTINSVWNQAKTWNYEELIEWAKKVA